MGQIKVTKCDIDGLCVIEPTVHGDARGYFMETYNQRDMEEAGLDMVFVQDNQSCSSKGDSRLWLPWFLPCQYPLRVSSSRLIPPRSSSRDTTRQSSPFKVTLAPIVISGKRSEVSA